MSLTWNSHSLKFLCDQTIPNTFPYIIYLDYLFFLSQFITLLYISITLHQLAASSDTRAKNNYICISYSSSSSCWKFISTHHSCNNFKVNKVYNKLHTNNKYISCIDIIISLLFSTTLILLLLLPLHLLYIFLRKLLTKRWTTTTN